MKRIISVILTIAMVLGISIETFAAYGGEKSRAYQSENCTITYSIANEWSGNQQISVSITNDGEETLRNWAIMFDNAGEITNISFSYMVNFMNFSNKRDITDDDFSLVKYYEKTTIPVKNE